MACLTLIYLREFPCFNINFLKEIVGFITSSLKRFLIIHYFFIDIVIIIFGFVTLFIIINSSFNKYIYIKKILF
jgi:hypothetical protein